MSSLTPLSSALQTLIQARRNALAEVISGALTYKEIPWRNVVETQRSVTRAPRFGYERKNDFINVFKRLSKRYFSGPKSFKTLIKKQFKTQ